MPRLSKEQKEQLRKDKSSMSVNELTAKYGISRATVSRIVSGKDAEGGGKVRFAGDENNITVPTMTMVGEDLISEFGGVLSGQSQEVAPPRFEKDEEKQDNAVDKKATERLAEHLFAAADEGDVPNSGHEDITQMVEDPVERTAVLQRIMLNLDNFGSIFTFIHDKGQFVQSLHVRSIADLKGILKTMEQTRTTVNLANQMKQTFLMVGKGTEVLGARFLRLKTDGFVNQLISQKQELDMIFRELAIDYAPKFTFQTRPELRLAMLYGMTLLQVDNGNRIKEYVAEASKQEAPAETAEAFSDL